MELYGTSGMGKKDGTDERMNLYERNNGCPENLNYEKTYFDH